MGRCKSSLVRAFRFFVTGLLGLLIILTLCGAAVNNRQPKTDEGEITATLSYYFSFRNAQFSDDPECDEMLIDTSVISVLMLRKQGLLEWEENVGTRFVDVKTQYSIESIEYCDGWIEIVAYEIETIPYSYDDELPKDVCKWGILHTIKLVRNYERGCLVIVSDDYVESGAGIDTLFEGFPSKIATKIQSIAWQPDSTRSMSSIVSDYNPALAVAYARQYAHAPYADGYICVSNDCANFVSTCLAAGGVNRTADWTEYTPAWWNCAAFDSYWNITRGVTKLSANNYSNCVAGNPIYYLTGLTPPSASGHLTICTGKNSQGIPIFCAHNLDMLDEPITSLGNTYALYTLTFTCVTHTYSYTDTGSNTQHKATCTACGEEHMEAHAWEEYIPYSQGTDGQIRYFPSYICTKCGKIVPYFIVE